MSYFVVFGVKICIVIGYSIPPLLHIIFKKSIHISAILIYLKSKDYLFFIENQSQLVFENQSQL